MSGCPKDKHKALLYRVERARRFSESANSAIGKLWREVRDAESGMTAATVAEGSLDEFIVKAFMDWRHKVAANWGGIWMPKNLCALDKIVKAGRIPAPRRATRRKHAK